MIDIKITSLISFLDVSIDELEIKSIKKGFGNYISKSLFDLIDDIETFAKSGVYKDVKGYAELSGTKTIVTYDNVQDVLARAVKTIKECVNDKYFLEIQNAKVYAVNNSYGARFKNVKSFASLLKVMQDLKFSDFKIYTNCGLLRTYHDLLQLDESCLITSIQYISDEIDVIFKNLNEELIRKIIDYHLKFY